MLVNNRSATERVFDLINDYLIIIDRDGVIQKTSRSVADDFKLNSITPEISIFDLIDTPSQMKLRNSLSLKVPSSLDITFIQNNEKIITTTVINFDHETDGYILLARPLSQSQLNDKKKRKFFGRALLETPIDFFFLMDTNGMIVDVNNTVASEFKLPPEKIIGKYFIDLVPPHLVDFAKAQIEKVLDTKQAVRYEKTHDKKTYDTIIYPIITNSPEEMFIAVLFRDISSRKRNEQEARKMEVFEGVNKITRGIAHDFNNLLTGIIGNISLAKIEAKNNSEQRECLEEAEMAALSAQDLSRRLLSFSGGGNAILKPVNMRELLLSTTALITKGLNIKADIAIDDKLHFANVDQGQITNAIYNLVLNAHQAMPEGGYLKITAGNYLLTDYDDPGNNKRYIKIKIKDTGCGIPEDIMDKLFDPYFTTKPNGTGMGLAVTFSIIKQHHGYLEIDSEVGEGSTFTIVLPATDEKPVAPKQTTAVSQKGEGRILIMDDERLILNLATKVLSRDGFQVVCATSGEEALEKFNLAQKTGLPFDLVVLDLTIPGGMGGDETLKRLKKINPEIKAIICSGYANNPILTDFDNFGFNAVVSKPYRPLELADAVKRLLDPD